MMSRFGWFGFREVDASGRWHAFRTNRPGAPSLCRSVRFGPERSSKGRIPDKERRSCERCAGAWSIKYPHPKEA